MSDRVEISVVTPVYNEAGNLDELFAGLTSALDSLGGEYEIIAVDDGSADESPKIIADHAAKNPRIKGILLRRNFGQTAAIAAGVDHSCGKKIILIDADLQNDPKDIEKISEKLDEGYDVVSGWRVDRKDPFLSRRAPSIIANWIISRSTGTDLHDYGCTLKGYRAEALKRINLYGEMHRFIPEIVSWRGAKIAEIPVSHHPRKKGASNYGIGRTFKVLLDLTTVLFLGKYASNPIYFFGALAFITAVGSLLSGAFVIYRKLAWDLSMIDSPLLHLTALLIILSAMFISLGLIAELLVRIYYETGGKTIYTIEEKVNIE